MHNLTLYSLVIRSLNDIMRMILHNLEISLLVVRTAWETPEVLIWTNHRLIRSKGSCPRTFDFIGGNMSGLWQCSGRYSRYAGNRMCMGEGTCSTSSPKGMYPGLGKDSFISRSRVSLSERSGGQSESRGLKCCQDQCTPLHDTNGNQKWNGRETRIEIRKVSPHEGAICRHCIAIDLALHSFANIAKATRMARFL